MATDYADESDLLYITGLDQIPGVGPDLPTFTEEDKLEAAEVAEAKLEADANDGKPFNDPGHLHAKAAAVYAGFWLFSEAEEPASALSGQIIEGSTADSAEFIDRQEKMYTSLVTSISNSDADESDTGFTFRVM